jgi:hypothetical protein
VREEGGEREEMGGKYPIKNPTLEDESGGIKSKLGVV